MAIGLPALAQQERHRRAGAEPDGHALFDKDPLAASAAICFSRLMLISW
ncbi:MAG: hypothetical protein JOZ49_06610 [Mycolicibacterium sp.]|nr:hypothetical protein [Mycolicibacterium sp.]